MALVADSSAASIRPQPRSRERASGVARVSGETFTISSRSLIFNRRDLLKLSLATTGLVAGQPYGEPTCATDGTPAQFIPKQAADPKAYENDLEKFAKCPYCGMDRRQYHHSRMLVHYRDDLPDGVCSLHCAAISLAVNVDREAKRIWVADNEATADLKPLVEVDRATFLIGSQIKGVMTRRSKVAYASEGAARAAMAANGGELGNFEQALLAAYTDGSQDVSMVRKIREERRQPGRSVGEIAGIWVTEFYGLTRIDARVALYVIGSDTLGPMGHEFVPLASRADAEDLLKDHHGKHILSFAQVTPAMAARLDEGKFD